MLYLHEKIPLTFALLFGITTQVMTVMNVVLNIGFKDSLFIGIVCSLTVIAWIWGSHSIVFRNVLKQKINPLIFLILLFFTFIVALAVLLPITAIDSLTHLKGVGILYYLDGFPSAQSSYTLYNAPLLYLQGAWFTYFSTLNPFPFDLNFQGSQFIPAIQIIPPIYGVLSLFAIYALSRNYLSEKQSLYAVLIALANIKLVQTFIELDTTAPLFFFSTMSLHFLVRYLKEHRDTGMLVYSLIMAGFAFNSKYLGLILLSGIILVGLIHIRNPRHILLLFLVPLASSSFYIYNLLEFGHPLYAYIPYLNEIVQTGASVSNGGIMVHLHYLLEAFLEFGAFWIMLAFMKISHNLKNMVKHPLFPIVIIYFATWFILPPSGRYLLPIFAFIPILAVQQVESMSLNPSKTIIIFASIMLTSLYVAIDIHSWKLFALFLMSIATLYRYKGKLDNKIMILLIMLGLTGSVIGGFALKDYDYMDW